MFILIIYAAWVICGYCCKCLETGEMNYLYPSIKPNNKGEFVLGCVEIFIGGAIGLVTSIAISLQDTKSLHWKWVPFTQKQWEKEQQQKKMIIWLSE